MQRQVLHRRQHATGLETVVDARERRVQVIDEKRQKKTAEGAIEIAGDHVFRSEVGFECVDIVYAPPRALGSHEVEIPRRLVHRGNASGRPHDPREIERIDAGAATEIGDVLSAREAGLSPQRLRFRQPRRMLIAQPFHLERVDADEIVCRPL